MLIFSAAVINSGGTDPDSDSDVMDPGLLTTIAVCSVAGVPLLVLVVVLIFLLVMKKRRGG